jgi:hypothetical protein
MQRQVRDQRGLEPVSTEWSSLSYWGITIPWTAASYSFGWWVMVFSFSQARVAARSCEWASSRVLHVADTTARRPSCSHYTVPRRPEPWPQSHPPSSSQWWQPATPRSRGWRWCSSWSRRRWWLGWWWVAANPRVRSEMSESEEKINGSNYHIGERCAA